MLNCIFMDVSPYFFNSNDIFKKSWDFLLNSQDQKKFKIDFIDEIKELIEKEPDFIEFKSDWLELIGQEKYDFLMDKFDRVFLNQLKDEYELNKFNQYLLNFIQDIHNDASLKLILLTNNKWLANFLDDLDLNVEIQVIDSCFFVTAQYLINYATKNNILCTEIMCISQVDETINDLIKNKIFCATINEQDNFNNKYVLVLKSIDELSFANITYNFCSINTNESTDF